MTLVYNSYKSIFLKDIDQGNIDQIILKAFEKKLHRRTSEKEIESWSTSLFFMARVISDPEIPDNAGVSIECQIPQTGKRIDFILSGSDTLNREHVIIIELKQWKTSQLSEKDGIIKTALGRGLHETNHPSYQAYSYSMLLEDFCETITTDDITLKPCAYLHNYEVDDIIRNPVYDFYTEKAPVFLKREIEQLRTFIKKYVHTGDNGSIMYRIDNGRIRPSKQLCDSLVSMIKGNREFILLDEQKLVYETALYLTGETVTGIKKVFIVEGGPGTGKSVVAINLLVELTKRGLLAQYVTKNAAPRAVYMNKLTASSMSKTRFYALFQGSGQYAELVPVHYELPAAAVSEAIVNAVAHRDYTSNASIQVMLFRDRLEIWNPGSLPYGLDTAKLRLPHTSIPANPLLADPMYLAGYIERLGTGTGDIISLCKDEGLKEPDFLQEEIFRAIIWRKTEELISSEATGQVTGQVTGQAGEEIRRILLVISGKMKRTAIQESLGLKHNENFRDNYLLPAIDGGYIEMTFPDSPNHPKQQYMLTKKGIDLKKKLKKTKRR